MNEDGNTGVARRYMALDIHKHYCVVAAVHREGRRVLQPVRVEHADLEGWLPSKNNQPKTARSVKLPNRFLFLMLLLIFLRSIP